MLRSVRFWLALILVCVLAGFLIHSAFRSQQTAQAPVISVSDEADETDETEEQKDLLASPTVDLTVVQKEMKKKEMIEDFNFEDI